MLLLVVILVSLNVLLCLSIAVAVFRYRNDRTILSLMAVNEPKSDVAAEARRRRLEADDNAWRS